MRVSATAQLYRQIESRERRRRQMRRLRMLTLAGVCLLTVLFAALGVLAIPQVQARTPKMFHDVEGQGAEIDPSMLTAEGVGLSGVPRNVVTHACRAPWYLRGLSDPPKKAVVKIRVQAAVRYNHTVHCP